MYRIPLVLGLFVAANASGQELRIAAPTCEISDARMMAQSIEDRCVLSLQMARCNGHDRCVAQCTENDVGRGIGGGCWHICFRHPEYAWIPEEEYCSAMPHFVRIALTRRLRLQP